ncbi:MAG: Gfo/Idh/MocA family protein [Terriglobia bacterium]
MNDIKVGIIGFGYTGRLHAQAYERVSGVRVTGVADVQVPCAELTSKYRFYSDYRRVLETDIDAVSVCLPTWLHCEVALAALERGKHVLVEKPIAASMKEAREMLNAARSSGKTLFVGMTHRFYPELREAKARIDDGAIGSIVMCNDRLLEHFGFLNLPGWYLDKRQAGGGAVLTSGIHLIDRVRWFADDEVAQVGGFASNPYFNGPVEDMAQIFLRLRGGVPAQISLALMRAEHPLVCDLELVGSKGTLRVHTWKGYEIQTPHSHIEKAFYTTEPHASRVLAGLTAEVEEFCRSIREERAPWPPAEDSVKSLQVVMVFYRAVATGQMENADAF